MKKTILAGLVYFLFGSLITLDAQWARTYFSPLNIYPYDIQKTSDGGYVVAGAFIPQSLDKWRALVIKVNSEGAMEWHYGYSSNNNQDAAHSVQQTKDGGYIVAGDQFLIKLFSNGTIEWKRDYRGAGYISTLYVVKQTLDGGYIVGSSTVLFKLTSYGDVEWQFRYGWTNICSIKSIEQTSDGGYVVAGWYTDGGLLVLKLKANGDIEWQHSFGRPNAVQAAKCVLPTKDGGYIVVGYTGLPGAANDDIWVLKLFPNGEVDWQRSYGGSKADVAFSVEQIGDGSYIIAGIIENVFGVLKLSSRGDMEWNRIYKEGEWGSDLYNWSTDIQRTLEGGYITACAWHHNYAGIGILKLFSDGEISPDCSFIGTADLKASETNVVPQDTQILPIREAYRGYEPNYELMNPQLITDLLCKGERYSLDISSTAGGTTDPPPGTYLYWKRTQVYINALPKERYVLSGWTGDIPLGQEYDNPLSLNMDANKLIRANFMIPAVYPPVDFAGQKIQNRSLFQVEWINVLSWKGNPLNKDVEKYKICKREGATQILLATLGGDKFEYWHRNVNKDMIYRYVLTAVNKDNLESPPVVGNIR